MMVPNADRGKCHYTTSSPSDFTEKLDEEKMVSVRGKYSTPIVSTTIKQSSDRHLDPKLSQLYPPRNLMNTDIEYPDLRHFELWNLSVRDREKNPGVISSSEKTHSSPLKEFEGRSSTLYGDHDRIMKDAGIFPAVHCSMPNEDVPISHFHSNSDQHPLSHFQPPNQKFVCCGSCRQWLQVYFSLIFTIIVKCIHRSFT